jgi:hypothetical protein
MPTCTLPYVLAFNSIHAAGRVGYCEPLSVLQQRSVLHQQGAAQCPHLAEACVKTLLLHPSACWLQAGRQRRSSGPAWTCTSHMQTYMCLYECLSCWGTQDSELE